MTDGIDRITASSRKSFDDAVRLAVERAERTVDHVNGAKVLEQEVVVRHGSVVEYRVVVSATVDALVSVDEHQTIVGFNRGAEAVFGYAAEDAVGRPLDTLIPPRYRAEHAQNVRIFAGSGVRERMMGERERIVGLRKDGTEFGAEASIAKRSVGGRQVYSVLLRELAQE